MDRVYLVPGFFGFVNLGDFAYWGHVQRALAQRLPGWSVHPVATRPTATLPLRAQALLERIDETSNPEDRVHIVGHSTGGLDGRLATAPGVVLPNGRSSREAASVVSVCTPHHGTPGARFFSTLQGKAALRVLSLATVFSIRRGRVPLRILLKLGEVVSGTAQAATGGTGHLHDELFKSLLGEFSAERRDAIADFLEDVSSDRALLAQLTGDAMQLFNASNPKREGVRYGSVVAKADRPRLGGVLEAGIRPTSQAAKALYTGCWNLAAAWSEAPPVSPPHADRMLDAWPELPTSRDNDGIVPTLSQPYGDIIRCVSADHLDVLGHFAGPDQTPPHYDWLPSGSRFTRLGFEALWSDIAHFLEAGGQHVATGP